jgi:hypothetical protein
VTLNTCNVKSVMHMGYGWLVPVRIGSSRSGFWYAEGVKPCVHVSAIGGMPLSIDHFWATGVTPVSWVPLITVGNLGVWSCLDII